MRNIFSIYLDGLIAQAVTVCISGDTVTIKDTHTFPHDDLDNYLSNSKGKSFVICCNPLSFHQDIIYLPPAAARHYDRLVHTEIRKIHPELASFSTFHSTVGQATIDSRVHNKIAAFSYEDDSLSGILATFNRHGKTVSHCYGAPYAIFGLIASTCEGDTAKARIFIASLPGEKLLLVAENGELEFIRKIPSTQADLVPADIQSLNMTLDYCLQALRVRPVEAVLLDQLGTAAAPLPLLTVPLNSSRPPVFSGVPSEVVTEYLAPIAAALQFQATPRKGDILPADYVAFAGDKKVLAVGSGLFIALFLLLASYCLTQWLIISDQQSGLRALRNQLNSSSAELATFQKIDRELKTLTEPMDLIRKHGQSLRPADALAALNLPGSAEYAIKGVSIQEGAGFLGVQIEGRIGASGFGNIQAAFERITEGLRRIPGYAVISSTLDMNQKSFSIQARYSGTGQRGRQNP